MTRAAELIQEADIPGVFEWSTWAGTPSKRGIRYTMSRDLLPKDQQPPRSKPPAAELRALYARDGWHRRCCGIRVIGDDAFKKLRRLPPEALRWGATNTEKHFSLQILRASHDHVLPRNYGGTNEPENLVTACWGCVFFRGDWLIEDVGVSDPRLRPPILDEWDDLRRVLSAWSSRVEGPTRRSTTA